jgi:hypothetical protein
MPKKELRKKKLSCGLWREDKLRFSKKAEKTDFEPLPKAQISFLGKMKHTKHLRIFSLQNNTKMKKIGDYDPFFDFFYFFFKTLARHQKKMAIPKVVTIFKQENFLNIGKDRNTLAIKSAVVC